MKKLVRLLPVSCLIFFLYSCSKKTVPVQPASQATVTRNNSKDTMMVIKGDSVITISGDSVITNKPLVKTIEKPVESTPKVITVNDKAARKTIDGRYYYDLLGHRYWRNNKDGKYYLYNKSMHNNPAFK